MIRYLFVLLLFISTNVNADTSPPINDDLANAISISNTDAFCTTDQAYSNFDATSSPNGTPANWNSTVGKDVWFKFTALKFDVAITASGKVNATSLNTLINPLVSLYTMDPVTGNLVEVFNNMLISNNVTSINKGGLTIGQIYYIRVSASNNNEGSFKLCIDNYFPPLKPGQDCGTFSILCSMEKFTQLNVTGAGLNNTETAGTCLGIESNSAWYMWTAGKNGDFTFLINPTVITNDIDWVLYDLGPGGDCSKAIATNAIRCASGSGIDCTPLYYTTGLSMTETDLKESPGCVPNQNGLVKYVDMIAGHNYALLIDNFSGGNNGFSIEFGGTTGFAGPTSDIKLEKLNTCTPQQSFTFTSLAANYSSVKWTFGEGASLSSATTEGPFNITYATLGEKTVVLEAKGAGGCNVVSTLSFIVANKPAKPVIITNKPAFCLGDIMKFSIKEVKGLEYHWSGPNNFTANTASIEIPALNYNVAGIYHVYTTIGDCQSEVAKITIPTIAKVPVASFDTTPYFNFKFATPLPIAFTNYSKDADSYLWDFGDGVTSTEISPTHTYLQSGTFKITLTAFADEGCSNALTKGDLIISNGILFIPNAFSPNGDNINDEFVVNVINLKRYQLFIYNRAGGNIFQTGNIFENWKGTYKNQNVPVGVYYYVIFAHTIYNQDVKYTGSLTLIR